jgi:hypothetical protein
MKRVLVCMFAVGLAASCEREVVSELRRPPFRETTWEVPFAKNVVFGGPTLAALANSDTLLSLYRTNQNEGEVCSKVCLVTLSTGLCRWLEYSYDASIMRISSKEIVVQPRFGHGGAETPWKFVDITSLRERIDANIPQGRYFHSPGVDAVLSDKNGNDIWLYDRAARQEYTLAGSQHGLARRLYIAMMPGRILLTGWPDDPNTFWLPHTQLWSFPELQKIAEFQTEAPWSWEVVPTIVGNLFVHPLAPGLLQVGSLGDGQRRFVIGRPPATVEAANEQNGGVVLVKDTSGYVRGTGVILTVEQIDKDHVVLNAYDVVTGGRVRTVQMHSKTLSDLWLPIDDLRVAVTKVGEEWVLLEQMIDPCDNPEEGHCRMRLIPYRIRDFQQADEPVDIVWDCFLKPIVDSGRLIVPGRDHVRVYSLADAVTFERLEGRRANPSRRMESH